MCFVKILFHFLDVVVVIEFAHEKKLFLTCFTHHKVVLWKGCQLDLWHKLHIIDLCIEVKCLKIGHISTEKRDI